MDKVFIEGLEIDAFSREKMDVLSEWARFLYEPLIEDRVRRITETDDPQFGRAVAQKVHEGLRRTGGVTPPRARPPLSSKRKWRR